MNILQQINSSLSNLTVIPNVEIDPVLAQQILEMNEDNRPLSSAIVSRYADAMKRGEWKFTGDTIAFSKSGRLLNGQHRISAIIKSGTTQRYNIQTGLEDSVFDVMDTGKNRTSSDVLSIAGLKYATTISGAVKIIKQYYVFRSKGAETMKANVRLTNHQILEWIEKNDARDALERYGYMASRFLQMARLLSAPTYCAFLYIFGNKNREKAISFFEAFASGENISSTHLSSIYLLRQRFINNRDRGFRVNNQSDKWALLIKAWNAYIEDRAIKNLSFNPDIESFPIAK